VEIGGPSELVVDKVAVKEYQEDVEEWSRRLLSYGPKPAMDFLRSRWGSAQFHMREYRERCARDGRYQR